MNYKYPIVLNASCDVIKAEEEDMKAVDRRFESGIS